MADKIKLLELDIDTASIIAKSVQLKKDLDEVRNSVNDLKKAGDTSSETFITQSAQMAKLSTEYNLNQKQLTNLVSASGSLLTASEKANAILGIEARSVNEARLQNSELLKIRNEINVKTPEGVIAVQKLNEKIDQNSQFIKENVSDLEKQKMNIGNYTDAINNSAVGTSLWGNNLSQLKSINDGLKNTIAGAKEELKKYAETIKEFTKGTEGMTTAQKASTIATNVGSGAMNIFKVALASTGIGLLVLALASLIGYFTQTQSGIDKLNSVLQPLKAIFSALYGAVLSLGGTLVDTFSNPKKAMNDLYEFVKTNLINRFKAFGEILEGIINLDFKKVTDGVLQAGTGVEGLTGKIVDGAQKASKFLDDNAKKGAEIARISKEVEESQLRYNANQIAVNDRLDEQLLISKDTSKSFAERQKASQEIIKITEENGKQEAKILQLKLQQLQVEQSLKGEKNLTNEDKQKTIDLLTQIDDAEDRGKEARLEQTRVFSGLAKEERKQREDAHKAELDRQQKEIDKAIEKTKQGIDLFVAEQGFRKKSLAEELIFEKQLVEEKQALLKQQLDNKRITELEYKTENLNLTNEYGLKLAEMLSANAEDEMKAFLENNQSKLDADKYLTDEMVTNELDRFNRVSEAEAEYQTKRLELGLINEREYKEAIKGIDEEYATNKKALEDLKLEEDTAKAIVDAENLRIANQQDADNQFADRIFNLEREQQKEIATAKKTGADVDIINRKYATLKKHIDKDVADYKMSQEIGLVRGLRGLVGEQTVLGKALAIADIAMTTIQGATKAFTQAATFYSNPATAALGVNATIQGGIIIATGVAQTAKILGLAEGVVDLYGEGSGTSDSIPAMLSKGESVIPADKTSIFKPLLKAIHSGNDVSYNENGYAVPSGFVGTSTAGSGGGLDYDLLANKIASANSKLPAPNLSLDYFHRENAGYTNLLAGANHG
jgi:hypothetical protein